MIQCSKCGENFATSSATTAAGEPVCLACVLLIRPELRGSVPSLVIETPAPVAVRPHPVAGGRHAAIARGVDEWERWLLDAGQPAMKVIALRSYRREVVGLLLDALAGMGAITWTGEATQ